MRLGAWMVGLLTFCAHAAVGAQCVDSSSAAPASSGNATPRAARLVFLGSLDDEMGRVRNDLGRCGGSSSLIRSALSLSDSLPGDRRTIRIAPIDPRFATAWNSWIPQSFNDGALWAGRGLSMSLTAGVRAEREHVTLILAPEYTTSGNAVTTVLPPGAPDRSSFASPWHSGVPSLDMPQRFGDRRYSQLGLGQSSLELRDGWVAGGFTTENQIWGPGIANALVMSDNAAGIPQFYVRTAHPVRTRAGAVEGRVLLGTLTESPYFAADTGHALRSLDAGVLTLRTALDTGLTIGFARGVYAAASHQEAVWGHWADVLTDWATDVPTKDNRGRREQINSLFARWVFPESGVEVYGEWAKMALPKSMKEFIVDPQRDQGYTLGLQWADALGGDKVFRAQAEVTTLEQTPEPGAVSSPSFYTSAVIPQGYTQRGQVIGAAIGPGSSMQWLAGDLIHRTWTVGAVLGRTRWDEDAYYAQPGPQFYFAHDIALFAQARAGLTLGRGEFRAALSETKRLNYLFQSPNGGVDWNTTFDVHNVTLNLTVIPHF